VTKFSPHGGAGRGWAWGAGKRPRVVVEEARVQVEGGVGAGSYRNALQRGQKYLA